MIEQYMVEGASVNMYLTGYELAEKLKKVVCDDNDYFTFETLVDTYGTGIEGVLTVNYKSTFRVTFTCNGSSDVTVQIWDMNGTPLGASVSVSCLVDATHSRAYFNVVQHSKSMIFGVSPWNNAAYNFSFFFAEYKGDIYCCLLPGYDTDLTFFKNDGIMYWSLKGMLNISVSGMNKGLFRAFMPTDSGGYCDIYTQMPDMYNINSGYPFTVYVPVTINGLEFLPLNSYTMLKVEEGSV